MQFGQLRRREFIALLGSAAAWPCAAQQSSRLIRIGFLGPTLNNPAAIGIYQAFSTRLGELGFRGGENLAIDYHNVDDPRGPFVVAAEVTLARPALVVTHRPE